MQTVIGHIKEYHEGVSGGKQTNEQITRGKALYRNPHQERIGIIITRQASVDVIKEAVKHGANLIIAHEALFRSHGNHTNRLQEENNQSFLAKEKLPDEAGAVVQRGHDYIRSGIPMEDDNYIDGISRGVVDRPGWTQYITKDIHHPLHSTISKTTAKESADSPIQKLQLNGVKIIGNKDNTVERVRIPFHILGDAKDSVQETDQEDISCYLTMEVVDFTPTEYIWDGSMLGTDKTIIGMGHFNLEEPGMEYMITYLPIAAKADIPCAYTQSGDMYGYRTQQHRKYT